jgi:hypothetical protein
MNSRSVLRWQRGVAAGLAVAVVGCSSTNPYQRSQRVDVPIAQLGREEIRNAHAERLAGNLHGALGVLKDQRREWYDSLSTQARVRAVTQLGLLGITAAALYSGLKSGVTTDHDKKRLALAGALGFAAYSGSTWFVNPNQEQAYVDGIRELTCAMLNIEPLRMSHARFREMQHEREALRQAIDALDKKVLEAEATRRYPRKSRLPWARVRVEAKDALWRARRTLTSTQQLLDQLDNSGVVLMREGDLVFARVAARINAAHKDITPPETLATQGAGIIKSFRSVKIDQASESSGGAAPNPQPAGAAAPAAAKAAATAATPAAAKSLGNASMTELLAQIDALQKSQIAAAVAKERDRNDDSQEDKDLKINASTDEARLAKELAAATAALYAARRPLSDRLLGFYEARKSVERNGSCVGNASAMTIAPVNDAKVAPNEVYEITVSGVTVAPQVALKGSATTETVVGAAANQYIVRVKVSADAKDTVTVTISDRGLATEEVVLTVD